MSGDGYGKVFASLWHGSLRGKKNEISVFIYLVCHADARGIVDIHPKVIAEATGIELVDVWSALHSLEAEDPESRSPEYGGQRIRLIDDHRNWGWWIVNHEKYMYLRSLDVKKQQDRERARRYRANQKQRHAASRTVTEHHAPSRAVTRDHDTQTQTHTHKKNLVSKLTVSVPKFSPEAFERFWSKYPKKKGRLEAVREWDRLKPTDVDLLAMSSGLERYVRVANPDYVMDPRRWLHGRRWEDQDAQVVLSSAPPKGPSAALLKAQRDREEWEKEQARGA